MTSIEIINNHIASLKEQAQIEKEQKTGNEIYCEMEIDQYIQVKKDLEDLEMYRREKYKHWNIFFNGAKLEYLLYLEQKGKDSFMASISEELYSKIKKQFLE